ncbi:LacI family transcriptional regulator [Paenibacillus mucilaginosus]|uniref:LacI family DNA-binding transcriptional regulator n=1 Tax=Paenibacillus mucilaginosus TaxID=61624 RepID=UPI003D1BABFC
MDIYDIARLAGVSRKTVQRMLNGSASVAPATADKIRRVMEEHHYEPNAAARRLTSKTARTIGLFIVQDERNYSLYSDDLYYGVVIGALISQCASRGYKTLVSIEDVSRPEPILSLYKDKSIDAGIVVSWSDMQQTVDRIAAAGFRIGVFDQNNVPHPAEGLVIPQLDNYESVYRAAAYLLDLGHTDIGVITGDMTIPCSPVRLQGFLDALAQRGIEAPASRIHYGRFREADGEAAVEEWVRTGTLPQAVFCSNDLMAYGVLRACKERGISIPGELSVIGFDDLLVSQYTHPPLTTMRVPRIGMAAQLANRLIDQLEGREAEDTQERFTAELVVRESCKADCSI